MAYQNVGTPRFYIDIPTYLNSIGEDYGEGFDKSLFTLNPITPVDFLNANTSSANILLNNEVKDICNPNKFYFAILNHNIEGENGFELKNEHWSDTDYILNHIHPSISNIGSSIVTGVVPENISTIMIDSIQASENITAGSVSFGSYYDMTNSADLDLTMEIEFDGYDTVETMGGTTLTSVRYNGSPYWFDKEGNKSEPFSIGTTTGVSKRNGRRVWNLKFSYISDENIFSSNYMSNNYLETSTDYSSDDINQNDNTFEYTLNNDDSFISQVFNKVGNGQKFIFQPDNSNNNPDQFAICTIVQDSLSIKQVAYKVYDFSLKIRETW